MTEDEMSLHRGLLHDKKKHKKTKSREMLKFNQSALSLGLVPDELDWRDYGTKTRTRLIFFFFNYDLV